MANEDQLERYKRAMDDALQQLDWVIGYLQGIHKQHIAKTLSHNRQHIATQIAGEKDRSALPADAAAEDEGE